MALDVETTGLDLRTLELRSIQLGWLHDDNVVGVVRTVEGCPEVAEETAVELARFVADGGVLWSYGTFDAAVLEVTTGVTVPVLDASRLHHLVDQTQATWKAPLKRAITATFNIPYGIDAVESLALAVDDPAFLEYAALDALGLRGLLQVWRQINLPSDDWTEDAAIVWVGREMRIQAIADEIGDAGVLVSPRRCDAILAELGDELAEARGALAALAPGLNPNSPRQVIAALEAAGITVPRMRRPKTGEYTKSGSSKALKRIKHPLVAALIEVRQTAASVNTVNQLMKAAGIDDEADFPRPARCTYKALGARTSRWSSSKPNLQNIPKGRMRDVMVSPLDAEEELDEEGEELSPRVAEVLVPRRGYVFVQADLSQIEYRIGAMLSGDKRMREIYLSGEGDLHVEAARILFGVDHPDDDHRQAAKGIGFGKFYGLSLPSMADAANVSIESMRRRVERYDGAFPGLKKWTDRVAKITEASGRTPRTPYGRTFKIPRSRAYMAVNYMCQSTAREVFCEWLLAIRAEPEEWHIVAAVHDEVLLEVPVDLRERAQQMLVRTAASVRVPGCDIPIVAKSAWSSTSWAAVYEEHA